MFILTTYCPVTYEPNTDENFYGPFATEEAAHAHALTLGFGPASQYGSHHKIVTLEEGAEGETWQRTEHYFAYVRTLTPPG